MHEVLPEGLPEVLCSCDAQDSKGLETLKRVYAESKLATHGYCLGWRPGAMKRRKVSPESGDAPQEASQNGRGKVPALCR